MLDISLVIATYNRGTLLGHALARLGQLALPMELIVVDDGGNDKTEEVVRAFAVARPEVAVRYIWTNNPGVTICSHARNVGVREARHDWIVTSEPELVWRSDVLQQFSQLESEHPGEIISSGTVHFAPSEWLPGPDYAPPQGVQIADRWVAPHVALWRRDWLVEIGGWDEDFPGQWGWDDTDLLTRLRLSGVDQHIAPEVEAIHLFHGLGTDTDSANEKYFFAKSFVKNEDNYDFSDPDHTDLVANKGRQWGEPKPR